MIDVLKNSSFRNLFAAQVVALVGTGLATVALALLAYDLAGAEAGAVLGTALAIKMIVYVTLAPVSAAVVPPALRKTVLIALDLARAAAALTLPFVTEIWQVYILIALLQSASACFTPLFQSLIPEILKDEKDYTKALSLSRLAYDLESLLSPALAAALLTLISFHGLFAGTSVGFVLSAVLVFSTVFPLIAAKRGDEGPYTRAIRGMRIYLRTPRLRGLLALNLVAAAGGSLVFVNTVVVVRSVLQGGEREVAWALAAFGIGSMAIAMLLPRLLDKVSDRRVMLSAAGLMCAVLACLLGIWIGLNGAVNWLVVIPSWVLLGVAYAGLVTPGGRLLRRSADSADLPFLFAAQFSLSHICWLIAYQLAGMVGAKWGMPIAIGALACLAIVGFAAAWRSWPKADPEEIEHGHDNLPSDHPHWAEHPAVTGRHSHRFVIDDLHTRWPH
ncbi:MULTISPECIES: MFS transporter [Stenotrophomonas]|uniref:Major facilitator transporter n=1 Tax=Stenotrophomonas nitritireducens TaxID=83617 RepID=A0ABR5NNA1_9GAMM|nr:MULTISPECIES: MFS transporter [Stenotrophomonas]KRG60208.1 major facilitator transporter [Stenotrophomonas nitritireducens]MCH1910436.1 MFS transporter [Stenotrophomonas sp. Y6]